MARLLQSLEPCTLTVVCSFLDPYSLGLVETAAFDRDCVAECWKVLRVEAEQLLMRRPRWRTPPGQPASPANHKHALREVILQLKSLTRVPESWIEFVHKSSDTVIEIQPRLAESVSAIGGLHRGGREGYVGPSSVGGQRQRRPSAPPTVAAVPLSVGGCYGDAIAVGVQLTSRSLGSVGEAFLLGVDFLGSWNGQGQVFTVCFSPVSGRVFLRFPDGEGLVAMGLPDLTAAAGTTELASLEMGSIEAFMFMSTLGGISFGRRRAAGGKKCNMEWCGELPPEFLPTLSEEKYASLTFQVDKLLDKATISITWAGQLLPFSAPLPTSPHTFCSIWGNYDW